MQILSPYTPLTVSTSPSPSLFLYHNNVILILSLRCFASTQSTTSEHTKHYTLIYTLRCSISLSLSHNIRISLRLSLSFFFLCLSFPVHQQSMDQRMWMGRSRGLGSHMCLPPGRGKWGDERYHYNIFHSLPHSSLPIIPCVLTFTSNFMARNQRTIFDPVLHAVPLGQ